MQNLFSRLKNRLFPTPPRSDPETFGPPVARFERPFSSPQIEQTIVGYLRQFEGRELLNDEHLADAKGEYLFVMQAVGDDGKILDVRVFAFKSSDSASSFGQYVVPTVTFCVGLTVFGNVEQAS